MFVIVTVLSSKTPTTATRSLSDLNSLKTQINESDLFASYITHKNKFHKTYFSVNGLILIANLTFDIFPHRYISCFSKILAFTLPTFTYFKMFLVQQTWMQGATNTKRRRIMNVVKSSNPVSVDEAILRSNHPSCYSLTHGNITNIK